LDVTAGGIVREKTVIVFQGSEETKGALKEYTITVPKIPSKIQASFVKVKEKRDRKNGKAVELELVSSSSPSSAER
jgi:hypothetical protein